jgi:saccharopine dehydrogenase (NADP+, L-glutamate forming)
MSKKVLVLGAGMVASPLVRYLMRQAGLEVLVADQELGRAQKLVGGSQNGKAVQLDIENEANAKQEISRSDLVISILPHSLHPRVAAWCIQHRKNLLTASYVSEEMKKLDRSAREAGIMLLNEIGLDPGLDHMEAMRIVHEVKQRGGEIQSFTSFCGGIPAPEANTNPLGYKFSWSPTGVLLAGKSQAQYLWRGEKVLLSPEEVFQNPKSIFIDGIGDLDGYPNRNALPYIDLYDIHSTKTMLRGTLRYKGWCSFIWGALRTGLLDEERRDWEAQSFLDFVGNRLEYPGVTDIKDLLCDYLNIGRGSDIIRSFEWLGLLSEESLPSSSGSPLEILAGRLQEKLQYGSGERDMVVLEHKFEASYPEDNRENITSTLIDHGIPYGDTAMARCVGLPLAISARLILEGKVNRTGVLIPIFPEIYKPVLEELVGFGIQFKAVRS